ncbi:hypothetical protein [Nodosilinea sp. P-1105]|uniref:hypothetical protein n=1 Tax=Nodosilinea sp. P-1105 TaxID=2546229 RepID=UPI00146C5FB5|nr:hypothetical protein [Nodosilinea sp. P-1105]
MSLQYLLDEHIPPLYRTQLVRREPELIVRIIGDPDAPAKGTLDPDILIWCEVHNDFDIESEWAVRPRDMARAILDYEPNIIHFSGHGDGGEIITYEFTKSAEEPYVPSVIVNP